MAKGYCRSSRFLLDQKIIPAFGDKPIDFQFINMRLHKVLEANGIDWRAEGLSFHSFRHPYVKRKTKKFANPFGARSERFSQHPVLSLGAA